MTSPTRENDANFSVAQELLEEWLQLLRTNKSAADDLYFESILPRVLSSIDLNPAHQAIREQRTNILVSLMGFSPETTVICTHVVRPERLLIVLSERAEESYERAYEFLRKHLKFPNARIQQEYVDPIDPSDIYNKVHAHLAKYGKGGRHVFDVTGGKKIMSATAGQVAWELEMPLAYVEGEYDPVIRRPRPGTERVMLLGNPSAQKQHIARENALAVYESGNFGRAVEAFTESAKLRTDSRSMEDIAVALCQVYAAWTDLDFDVLKGCLEQLTTEVALPRIVAFLRDRGLDQRRLTGHRDALQAVVNREPLAVLASYLELAGLYRRMGRHDFACLLIYRAMEALVAYGLKQAANGPFNLDEPKYDLLGDEETLLRRYTELSRKMDRGRQVEASLPYKLGLRNGLAILCLITGLHEREPYPMTAENYLKRVEHEARRRNQSKLAHGDLTLTAEDSVRMLERASELARKLLQSDFDRLQKFRQDLQPLPLQDLFDARAC